MSNASSEPTMSPTSLRAAKKALRTVMKSRLANIPEAVLEAQSQKLTTTLLSHPIYQRANRISIYLSMPRSEIQTDQIVRHALMAGKTVFVPYLHLNPNLNAITTSSESSAPKSSTTSASTSTSENASTTTAPRPSLSQPKRLMDIVRLHGLEDYDSLLRDAWGIPTVSDVSGRDLILGGGSSSRSSGDRDGGDGDGGGNSGSGNDHGAQSESRPSMSGGQRDSEGLELMLMPGVAFEVQGKGGGGGGGGGGGEERLGRGGIRRLGHGGGFYDLFLERYASVYHGDDDGGGGGANGSGERKKKIKLYGLALEEQLLDKDADGEKGKGETGRESEGGEMKEIGEYVIPVGELDHLLDGVLVGDGRMVESGRGGGDG